MARIVDLDELKAKYEKIYRISCKDIRNCDECINGLKWCPKSYADELRTAINLIDKYEGTVDKIIKDKNL
jgi:hypothetical protein